MAESLRKSCKQALYSKIGADNVLNILIKILLTYNLAKLSNNKIEESKISNMLQLNSNFDNFNLDFLGVKCIPFRNQFLE